MMNLGMVVCHVREVCRWAKIEIGLYYLWLDVYETWYGCFPNQNDESFPKIGTFDQKSRAQAVFSSKIPLAHDFAVYGQIALKHGMVVHHIKS